MCQVKTENHIPPKTKAKLIPKCSFLVLKFDNIACQNNRAGGKSNVTRGKTKKKNLEADTSFFKSETEVTSFKGKCQWKTTTESN